MRFLLLLLTLCIVGFVIKAYGTDAGCMFMLAMLVGLAISRGTS